MARSEYNPRLPEVRQQPTLEPTVRSYPLSSYDEKRADYIALPDRNAGGQWEQLARALNKWEPALERYTESYIQDEVDENWAKARDLASQEEYLETSIEDYIKENPKFLGHSPAFVKGWKSMQLERLGMKYDTDMRNAYVQEGWVNITDPEEYHKKSRTWSSQWRQENLKAYGEGDLPMVDKYFTGTQLRAENNLDSYHSGQRAEAALAGGLREMDETMLTGLVGIVRSPHYDFFAPAQAEQNAARLGAFLTNVRDRLVGANIRKDKANERIQQNLLQYATAMDIEQNDFRADMLFAALNYVPTGTGVLGGTAASRLMVAEFSEGSDARRYKAEEADYRRQERKREESKRLQTEAVVWGLNDKPDASLDEIAAARNIPVTADTVREYNTYRKALSEAAKVMETPANTLLTAELSVAIREGRKDINDGLEALRAGQITSSQWDTIRGEAPKDSAYIGRMKKLTQNAGMPEAEAFIRKAWTTAAEGTIDSKGVGTAQKVSGYLKAETAVTLFKNAVYKEIEILEANEIPVDYNRALAIVEKHKAALGDVQSSLVIDAATAREKNLYSFEPVQAAQNVYQEAAELGRRGELTYTPSPDSPVSMAPPRALRLLENGANKAGIDPLVVYAFAKYESSFKDSARPIDPKTGKPRSSAYGYMQLLDGTATDLGVDKYDPAQNAYGGAKYIKQIADQHGLDLTNPEDVAKAYCYYHDGPNTKGGFSETARTAAAKVAATFQALQKDSTSQREERSARHAEDYRSHLEALVPDLKTASEMVAAHQAGKPHPVFAAYTKALTGAGLPLPQAAELERAITHAYAKVAGQATRAAQSQQVATYDAMFPYPPQGAAPRTDDTSVSSPAVVHPPREEREPHPNPVLKFFGMTDPEEERPVTPILIPEKQPWTSMPKSGATVLRALGLTDPDPN